MPADTAAADPPELPPGTYPFFHGLCTLPKKLVSLEDPIANSSIFVLPIVIDPASSRFFTAVAEYGGIKLASIFDEHVVLRPSVQNKSFCARGIPASMELLSLSRSIVFAFFLPNSSFIVTKQFSSLYFFAN